MAEAPDTRPTLLMRLRERGADSSWSQFVEIYAPLLYKFARKQGLQDADAADVTQDALRAVAQALPQLEYDSQRGSFRGWLFTVVRSKLATFRQRQAKQMVGAGEADLRDQPAPAVDEEEVWRQEYRQRLFNWAATKVEAAVEPKTWQAFWQTATLGRGAKDVAAELGLSLAAVYMARSRVLARIKAEIEQVQGESADE